MAALDQAFEFMLPYILTYSPFRNYNNYIYVFRNGKWILLDTTYPSIQYIIKFRDSLEKQTEALQKSIDKTFHTVKACEKFIKKIRLHLQRNLPNTAEHEDECHDCPPI